MEYSVQMSVSCWLIFLKSSKSTDRGSCAEIVVTPNLLDKFPTSAVQIITLLLKKSLADIISGKEESKIQISCVFLLPDRSSHQSSLIVRKLVSSLRTEFFFIIQFKTFGSWKFFPWKRFGMTTLNFHNGGLKMEVLNNVYSRMYLPFSFIVVL